MLGGTVRTSPCGVGALALASRRCSSGLRQDRQSRYAGLDWFAWALLGFVRVVPCARAARLRPARDGGRRGRRHERPGLRESCALGTRGDWPWTSASGPRTRTGWRSDGPRLHRLPVCWPGCRTSWCRPSCSQLAAQAGGICRAHASLLAPSPTRRRSANSQRHWTMSTADRRAVSARPGVALVGPGRDRRRPRLPVASTATVAVVAARASCPFI